MIAGVHSCKVLSNEEVADRLYIMSLQASELAEGLEPGQFVHMSIPALQANILRRPFSVLDTDPTNGTIDILYQVVGEGSADMTRWNAGYVTDVIGPLGRTWKAPEDAKHALLVGGGVGAAPLFMLAKQLGDDGVAVDVALGASTKRALVCLSRFEQVATGDIRCATDDGSFGHHGFCTALVEAFIKENEPENPYDYIAICGPEPMMRGAGKAADPSNATIQVSLEKRMACGVGACLSCVVMTTSGQKRVCKDGPIFSFSEVIW